MDRLEFAVVGDNCIDRYLPPIGQSYVGGNAINVAVQLSRRARRVGYFGAVGNDSKGRRILRALAGNGVDVANVQVKPGATAHTNIKVDEIGEHIIAYENFGVCAGYRPSKLDMDRILSAGHVHIGWLADGGALRRALVAKGVRASQDVSVNADRENLGVDGLEVAFVSAGADRLCAAGLIRGLLAAGTKLAVATCGPLGCAASDGATTAETSSCAVDIVDTTGAGDSFIAGFLSAYFRSADLTACLEEGRDAAAIACTHFGGFSQSPRALRAFSS